MADEIYLEFKGLISEMNKGL